MGVRGDFANLDRLLRSTQQLSSEGWRRGMARNVAEAALEEIARSFAGLRDPWDRPWKRSLRAKLEGGQTLSDTGRLRRSFSYAATPEGFTVGTNVKYARIHQYGGVIRPKRAKHLRFPLAGGSRKRKGGRGRWVQAERVVMPARPFVPEPGLSPRWTQAFAEAVERYVEASLDR